MTLNKIRTIVNAKLLQLKPIIEDKQAAYFARKGIYWQGIANPANLPKDGMDTDMDLSLKPSYQDTDWHEIELPIDTKLPFQLIIHQYETPKKEFGYQVIVRIQLLDDSIYNRSQGYGVESDFRTWDWVKENIE